MVEAPRGIWCCSAVTVAITRCSPSWAMALYYHFAKRDEIVDGIVDLVFGEIELPPSGAEWKPAMRRRAISLRDALLRHRWAIGLMESRHNPGPATCDITTP